MPNPGKKILNNLYNVQKKTLQQIADFYGVCRERVRQWMEWWGISRRHQGTKSILIEESKKIRKRYIEGEVVIELAKTYKVSPSTLYQFLQRRDPNIKLKRKAFREKMIK